MSAQVMDRTKIGEASGPVVELRRYRLRPGAREELIALFEEAFITPQEEAGMQVIGQFRDLDDPDAFVWLRGFADMETRARALAEFYSGPVWAAHRDRANGTMVNSDNVLLLRPALPGSGFKLPKRPDGDAARPRPGLVVATTCSLAPRTDTDFAAFFETRIRPALAEAGAQVVAAFVTEQSPNTFPRLPVREGETVFVWFSGFADEAAYARHRADLARLQVWTSEVLPEMERRIWRPNEVSRLVPTAGSRLRG